jgi:hypothetical protein
MSTEAENFDVVNAIICDDIRREDNGKAILIGVYGSNIILQSLPATLALSIWVHLDARFSGEKVINFRVIGTARNPISELAVDANIARPGGVIVPIPPFPVFLESEGELTVEMRVGDGAWVKIRALKVELRKN